jgi:hypothetical protein
MVVTNPWAFWRVRQVAAGQHEQRHQRGVGHEPSRGSDHAHHWLLRPPDAFIAATMQKGAMATKMRMASLMTASYRVE